MNKIFILIFLSFLSFSISFAQTDSVIAVNLKQHISFLASDKLEGRGTATKGEKKAAKYISKFYHKIGIAPAHSNYLQPFESFYNNNPHDTLKKNGAIIHANNIVAFLDNHQPYTIVLGAHYDHLGLGKNHNSLDANPEGKIHHGADDNASGTAAVMELAEKIRNSNLKWNYNFLFIHFSGEELGLLGSKKWCDNPEFDLTKIDCMINFDMVGRLNDSNKLLVYGIGTASSLNTIVEENNQFGFKLVKDSSGIGPSDHTSFYLKNIPVLHFFTGQHKDYHKPSDVAEKINYAGEVKVIDYVFKILSNLNNQPKLTFMKTRQKEQSKSTFKVTLGIMPDYAFNSGGLRIDGVSDNKPASNAGLQTGDIILQLGELKIKDIYDYMKALNQYKKGDTTHVQFKRGTELITKEITF